MKGVLFHPPRYCRVRRACLGCFERKAKPLRVFVYEHICATAEPGMWPESLLNEGRAMLDGLIQDLLSFEQIKVVTALHVKQPPLGYVGLTTWDSTEGGRDLMRRAANECDKILLIAPEFDLILFQLACWVEQSAGTLAGPTSEEIWLYSDKMETTRHLGDLGIATFLWPQLPPGEGKIVLKPRFGAGCVHTWSGTREDVQPVVERIRAAGYLGELVTQPFHPGKSFSIAAIGLGLGQITVLPTVRQMIQRENLPNIPGSMLHYEGGEVPVANEFEQRGKRLLESFAECSRIPRGYFGIDFLLGSENKMTIGDRICEVNPRLTTSYLGYRELMGPGIGKIILDGVGEYLLEGVQLEGGGRGRRNPFRFGTLQEKK